MNKWQYISFVAPWHICVITENENVYIFAAFLHFFSRTHTSFNWKCLFAYVRYNISLFNVAPLGLVCSSSTAGEFSL